LDIEHLFVQQLNSVLDLRGLDPYTPYRKAKTTQWRKNESHFHNHDRESTVFRICRTRAGNRAKQDSLPSAQAQMKILSQKLDLTSAQQIKIITHPSAAP